MVTKTDKDFIDWLNSYSYYLAVGDKTHAFSCLKQMQLLLPSCDFESGSFVRTIADRIQEMLMNELECIYDEFGLDFYEGLED